MRFGPGRTCAGGGSTCTAIATASSSRQTRQFDVGVDAFDFRPVTLETILSLPGDTGSHPCDGLRSAPQFVMGKGAFILCYPAMRAMTGSDLG